ncbi:ATP synthase subunit I [Sulfitobacter sp. CW3]|uniref:N-ATPase subunit AtpR n=1 Tax=Sulfitobacter sp. CW3 TaxID=2861965 RepID=UPI001C5F6A12|nr:ATP synthase subunit I [Sulfitobacter sp. CW3]MBW4964178.1 ATP synthase subunit AtpR [Sulfitobacter sp. CW3]
MIAIDWTALLMGAAAGFVLSALFFVGLAFGMRQALRRESPVVLLTVSAVIRIAALLGVGWVVLGQGGTWAFLGYALAFLLTRIIATTFARIGLPARGAS